MIDLTSNNIRFVHRTAGVAVNNGHALLHRAEWEDFWSLPGGRVEMRETAAEAIIREMREEIDADVRVERLLWVVESFFEYNNQAFHELGLYFHITLPPDSPLLATDNSFLGDESGIPLIYRWFPQDALEPLELYPAFLKTGLQRLPQSIEHVINREVEILPIIDGVPRDL